MELLIIFLFAANSIAHWFSYGSLKAKNDPGATGVLGFVFINLIIAILLSFEFDWAKWPALIFPLIGGMGLLITTILKGKGTFIDYLIFVLDVITIFLVLRYFFL